MWGRKHFYRAGSSAIAFVCLAVSLSEAQQQTSTPTSTQSPSAPETSVQKVQPVFRNTKPDEQRVEGLLQRIDCSLRGAVTFVLQAGDEMVRMSAPKLKDVDFITYRDDVGGDVKCGALKEPMRVYVTSRDPAKPNGARTVVAVEFLPKQ